MPIFRWGNPLGTFQDLEREMMDRWVRLAFEGLRAGRPYPVLNLYETPSAYLITAELPGCDGTDLEISISSGELTLRGNRSTGGDIPEQRFRRSERLSGAWERKVSLPERVDEDHILPKLTNGLLRLHLPKLPATAPRQIQVAEGRSILPQSAENVS